MQRIRRSIQALWPVLLIAAVIIIADQWTKEWVRQTIPLHSSIIPIPELGVYFLFEHVNNYGAAFGILQNQGNFFIIIAAVVVVAILYYVLYLPPEQRWIRFLLGLQLGGAIGNVIDRLNQGYVTDFVKMGVPGSYYWPNYNIADSAIVCGVIGLGAFVLWDDIRQQRQQKEIEQSQAMEA